MTELLKLLDSGVDDVKAGLAGKSREDLIALQNAETDGKTRKGVLDAIAAALAEGADDGVTYSSSTDRGDGDAHHTTDAGRSAAGLAREGETTAVVSSALTTASTLDNSGLANIAPATEFSPSGAPRQSSDIDPDHPAVDNDPRAGTTVDQNRIDFNDPVRTGSEIVTDALKAKASD